MLGRIHSRRKPAGRRGKERGGDGDVTDGDNHMNASVGEEDILISEAEGVTDVCYGCAWIRERLQRTTSSR